MVQMGFPKSQWTFDGFTGHECNLLLVLVTIFLMNTKLIKKSRFCILYSNSFLSIYAHNFASMAKKFSMLYMQYILLVVLHL